MHTIDLRNMRNCPRPGEARWPCNICPAFLRAEGTKDQNLRRPSDLELVAVPKAVAPRVYKRRERTWPVLMEGTNMCVASLQDSTTLSTWDVPFNA